MSTILYNHCPVCKSTKIEHFLHVPDHSISKEAFDLFRCSDCSFVFTQQPPAENEIAPYYSSDEYISHSDTNKGLVNKLYHLVRKVMLKRKWKMILHQTNKKRLLDIGSGTGYFLRFMRDRSYQTVGIEVSEEAKKIAIERFGLDIRSAKELLDRQLGDDFDIITMWHVLEHLYDLDRYMQAIHASLNNDGILVIALPNKDSFDARYYGPFWAAYDVPRHLWHFTPDTLQGLASRHGFQMIRLKKLPFDAFYNSLLSEKYKGNKFQLFAGFIIGLRAHLISLFNIKKSSSVVYLLKKISA